jgi:hypothetical protein
LLLFYVLTVVFKYIYIYIITNHKEKGDLMSEDRNFLDTKQLADRWRRSPRTIEGWRNKKIGPDYLNLNGKIVYDIEEIIKAEEEAKVSHETRTT